MNFAERLYALRREKGLSQEELAEVVGVTRQAVQKWESGASRPDMDNLTALARYFGVTLDYLITGAEPPAPAAGTPTVIEKHYYRECGDFFRPRGDYEYVSRRTLWGLPLVHIHISGRGLARARGIIAVGNVATGLVSLGVFSAGLLSLGVISLGVLLSIGCVSAGTLSLGCFSFGWLALGAVTFGRYAIGGVAVASRIALGGVANGPLAIGGAVKGTTRFRLMEGVPVDRATRDAIRQAVAEALGGRLPWLRWLFTAWF